jgi:hypothetical protein
MKQIRILLLLLLSIPPAAAGVPITQRPAVTITAADRYWRTELYFGLGKQDGTVASEDEWQRFLAEEVMPRFPEGLTIIDARGQYRNFAGKIVREPSRVLIVLYRKRLRKDAERKIDAICETYKRLFQQESVLRVTASKSSIVTF